MKDNTSIKILMITGALRFLLTCVNRKSILEMKRDHEDQIQRLKKLKDEEIDAVTSATSQTRCAISIHLDLISHLKLDVEVRRMEVRVYFVWAGL